MGTQFLRSISTLMQWGSHCGTTPLWWYGRGQQRFIDVVQQMFTDVSGSGGRATGPWLRVTADGQTSLWSLYHIWRAPGISRRELKTRAANTHSHTHAPQVFTMVVNMTIWYKTYIKILRLVYVFMLLKRP